MTHRLKSVVRFASQLPRPGKKPSVPSKAFCPEMVNTAVPLPGNVRSSANCTISDAAALESSIR